VLAGEVGREAVELPVADEHDQRAVAGVAVELAQLSGDPAVLLKDADLAVG
jgi:hypothetical protein